MYYETLQKSGYQKYSIKNLAFDFMIFFANTLLERQKKQKSDISEYEIEDINISAIENENEIEAVFIAESEQNTNVIYTKKEFLEEVFMTSERYDTLVQVLFNKKNMILQGHFFVFYQFILTLCYKNVNIKTIHYLFFTNFQNKT